MSSSGIIPVVVDGPGVTPNYGDVWVEPSASRRREIEAMELATQPTIVDPQHGGSRHRSLTASEAAHWDRRDSAGRPVAACIAAFRACLPPAVDRVVLRADAGLDDYAAAAVLADLVRPLPYPADVVTRLEAVSIADSVSWAGLPEWAPGQRLDDVTTSFPGLSRLCACGALSPRRRAELVAQWLMTGGLTSTSEEVLALTTPRSGLDILSGGPWADNPLQALYELDDLARAERDAVAPQVRVQHLDAGLSVALVTSPMTGLSGGRGAIGYGYQYAPVVVACSPLQCRRCAGSGEVAVERLGQASCPSCEGAGVTGRRLVTIARAANARRVSVDWRALLDALNAREPGWGGNLTSGIIGSPKPGGTALPPDEIAGMVAAHVRVTA